MSARYITLGHGRKIGLGRYVQAWKTCLGLDSETPIGRGVDGWGQNAGEALTDLRRGLHDRINRHIPGYGMGRKWSFDWQSAAWCLSRDVNTPRLIVRWRQSPIIAREYRARLEHRIEFD